MTDYGQRYPFFKESGQVYGSVAIHFAISHTRSIETRLPLDVPPATLGPPPSGGLPIEVDPREELVRSSSEFLNALASVLPYSAEDERLVARRIAEVTVNEHPRPLTRPLED